jgi:hypothetical protein
MSFSVEMEGMESKNRWKWWPLIAASSRRREPFSLMGESVRPRPTASRRSNLGRQDRGQAGSDCHSEGRLERANCESLVDSQVINYNA